jgi:hypothetical protein
MNKSKWTLGIDIVFAIIAGIGLYFGWHTLSYIMLALIVVSSIWSLVKKS